MGDSGGRSRNTGERGGEGRGKGVGEGEKDCFLREKRGYGERMSCEGGERGIREGKGWARGEKE